MPMFVADTHSLLWYFARPKLLGPAARAAFEQVASGEAELVVPVIVLAELIFALESKPLSANFDLVLSQLQASSNVVITDWTLARTLDLRTLKVIPEMHDRVIVAEALAHGATLITRDQAITASGLVPVVW
jgi:PIN domain nuclease of toxin-antitoxin system